MSHIISLHFHEKGYDKLAMMFHANVPSNFKVGVFLVALYLFNKIPSTTLNFDTLHIKLIFLKRYNKHKFTKKTCRFVFLAYSSLQKRYKCLHASPNKWSLSRHVSTCKHWLKIQQHSSLQAKYSVIDWYIAYYWYNTYL